MRVFKTLNRPSALRRFRKKRCALAGIAPSAQPKGLYSFGVRNDREVAEWSKAHAWNACVEQSTEGSNPFLSAII